MPNCRNCGARLNKWDSDVCPVCGIMNPLQGVTSETIEVTNYQMQADGLNLDKTKKRKTTTILFCTCGWTGAGFFYLNFFKRAIIWLVINLLLIAGCGLAFWLAAKLNPVISFVIPLAMSYVINIVVGIIYLIKGDVRDGNGEFIQ